MKDIHMKDGVNKQDAFKYPSAFTFLKNSRDNGPFLPLDFDPTKRPDALVREPLDGSTG